MTKNEVLNSNLFMRCNEKWKKRLLSHCKKNKIRYSKFVRQAVDEKMGGKTCE